MRAIVSSASVVVLLIIAYFSAGASAHPEYQSLIPNGANVVRNGVAWPGVGHVTAGGGTARNPFGLAFASAGHQWTVALCNADSDSDGVSNGMELGDPNCVWKSGATPSRTTDISHPGFNDSIPAASTTTTAAPTTTTTTTKAPTTTTAAPTTTTQAPTTTTTKAPTPTTKAPTMTTKAPTTTTKAPSATPAPPNNQNTPPATPATAPPATTANPDTTTTTAPTSPSTSDVPQFALYGTVAAAVLLYVFVRQ